tara:strand:- start:160 stop:381 length:222 start_codon:yes stop_codon:yes gene_type:complete
MSEKKQNFKKKRKKSLKKTMSSRLRVKTKFFVSKKKYFSQKKKVSKLSVLKKGHFQFYPQTPIGNEASPSPTR